MSVIVRVELFTDTRMDIVLREVMEIIGAHPGNDIFELIVHRPEGLRVFTSERTVDSWDPNLRRKLKQAVAAP